jgi:hypothetical protein
MNAMARVFTTPEGREPALVAWVAGPPWMRAKASAI